MARLIPSFMDDRTPPGERDVFNMLAGGPSDWVAVHSLDLAPWNRGLRTEVDFLIVIPDAGILCVEVKSHENISFDGFRWHPDSITRSPFKQASDGRHTFHRRFSEIAPQLKRVPVVHCCIFPRATFELHRNLSVQPWELMDINTFRTHRDADAFCADLRKMVIQGVAADRNLTPLSKILSPIQIETIVKSCVPVQKRRIAARDEIEGRQAELERILREQQKSVLRLADVNDRLIVSGAAGTGKTLIAMELARRAAEAGWRVAMLCFNQLVGDWMTRTIGNAKSALPNLVVGRAIRVMADMTGIEIPTDPSPEFWEVGLPQLLEDRLTDPDFSAAAVFDYLVLDEAQDVLARPHLWQCLTQFLSGGSKTGSFALFGDFDHQVLADRELMNAALEELDTSNRPARWRLSENCRNYRVVGETAVRLAGFSNEIYSAYLRVGGGVQNYDISFYESDQEQMKILDRWLVDFKGKGYRPSEITLLSFRADNQSAGLRLTGSKHKVRPVWQTGDHTAYASVQAFKGMENKIVILTDVNLGHQNLHRDLLYTGMTRATESVRIACDKASQEVLFQWLSAKGQQ